jgi:hypothetical protein
VATLGDLKARVISETLRDDLADDMATQFTDILRRAVDQYAAVRWWFNERRVYLPTTAGQPYVVYPADCRVIDGLYYEQGGGTGRWPLTPRLIEEWEALAQPAVMAGQPTDYLVANDDSFNPILKLFPTPAGVYQLVLDYIADVAPPLVLDTDSNIWTNQGADLVTAQAKIILYRDYLSATAQDPRLALAMAQEDSSYSRLRSESNRRTATGRVRPGW